MNNELNMIKHAVLLAGGEGTRLRPFSFYTSKHLEDAEGIPHALKLCEKFIKNNDHYLALGDNILIGSYMMRNFKNMVSEQKSGTTIIGYPVKNISDFGIAEFNSDGSISRVIEKPTYSSSNLAVVGLYKFDSDVFNIFDNLVKSKRGEYEIADIINHYIKINKCSILKVDSPANYWLDTGTMKRINSASLFIKELSKAGNIDFGDI